MSASDRCACCGQPVALYSGDEGTNSYRPLAVEQRDEARKALVALVDAEPEPNLRAPALAVLGMRRAAINAARAMIEGWNKEEPANE